MELPLAIPTPILAGAAAMQITTTVACPLRNYPYLLMGVSVPHWLTNILFLVAEFLNVSRCVGIRQAAAIHAVIGGLALIDMQLATMAGTFYLVAVHTPLHYLVCLRRGQRKSVIIATILTIAAAFVLRVMKPRGNIMLTYKFQKLVIAHTLTEWRVQDWYLERAVQTEYNKRRRASRRMMQLWMPAWARERFVLDHEKNQ